MNDFTKDELEIISQGFSASIGEYIDSDDEVLALKLKIQSLIDNYCEPGQALVSPPFTTILFTAPVNTPCCICGGNHGYGRSCVTMVSA